MFCKNCGSEIPDGTTFCSNCGAYAEPAPRAGGAPQTLYYPLQYVVVQKQTNTIAIVGFILSFFIAIVGLVCSIIGYKKAPQYNGDGKGLATAGIVISTIQILIVLLWSIIIINIIMSATSSL